MGLLDQLAGQVLGSLSGGQQQGGVGLGGGSQAVLLQAVIGLIQNSEGGIGGLLGRLTQGGLGDQVASWVGTGQNLPVGADQLGAALGSDSIGNLASQLGVSEEHVTGGLAQLLPQVIDHLTPQGQLPESQDALGQGLAALGALFAGGR